MKSPIICAAVVAMMLPAAGWADDPRDPAMRNAAARARDAAMTRRLNLDENAMVQRRGVRWSTPRADSEQYGAQSRDHEQAMESYTRDREQYRRELADWHRAVAACRAGDYAACDN